MSDHDGARFVGIEGAHDVDGAVVVVDVLRAFTTAAYAFAAGARHVYLVAGVDEALAFKASRPGVLAMGEEHGRRPAGFDFANSPTELAAADVGGRVIVQRTSAGTQGVVAARRADTIVVRRAGHSLCDGRHASRRRPGPADLCDHRLVGLGAGVRPGRRRDR